MKILSLFGHGDNYEIKQGRVTRKLSAPSDAEISALIEGERNAEKEIDKDALVILQNPEELDKAMYLIVKTLRDEGGRLPLSALAVDCRLPFPVVRSAVNILQRKGQVQLSMTSLDGAMLEVAATP